MNYGVEAIKTVPFLEEKCENIQKAPRGCNPYIYIYKTKYQPEYGYFL